jgi:UPF0755 protein
MVKILTKNFIIRLILLLIFLILFALFFPGPLAKDSKVVINRGDSSSDIALSLRKQGALYNKYLFVIGVKVFGLTTDFPYGEYKLPQYVNLYSLLFNTIKPNNAIYYKILLIEGYTVKQALQIIKEDNNLDGELTIIPPEGSLMPNTYFFIRGETKNSIVIRMQKSMEEYLERAWQNRAEKLPYKNKEQVLIMASLIEKETTLKAERPTVASVFLNRLRIGMRLQTDPTIAYALGRLSGEGLTREDLKFNSPYNTYLHYGLPPKPIANPSKTSIDAALNPAKTSYLYFVADGKGGHLFGNTLIEHNENVKKWREIERSFKLQK